MIYSTIIKPLLFKLEPETAHHFTLEAMRYAGYIPFAAQLSAGFFTPKSQRVELNGVTLKNPLIIAAGLDKNGVALPILSNLGFGAIELGGVTAQPQVGNPAPRVFRFPKQDALINRMGLPGEGADKVAERLRVMRDTYSLGSIGVNVAKSTNTTDAPSDMAYTVSKFTGLVDYYSINISCPNSVGYQALQNEKELSDLLRAILAVKKCQAPLYVKISPDLNDEQLETLLKVVNGSDVHGVISCNTTKARANFPQGEGVEGGLSGKPLYARALELVKKVRAGLDSSKVVIGCGGVSTQAEYQEMLRAGAKAVQVYTALVYQGPGLAKSWIQ